MEPTPAQKPPVYLDSSKMVLLRLPRSKKRRIRRKWLRRKENWGPDQRLWGSYLTLGAAAGPWKPHLDPAGNRLPDSYTIHPEEWRRLIEQHPEYADKFTVIDGDAELAKQCPGFTRIHPWERRWKSSPRPKSFTH